jgi:Ca-activated chloride channel family protein
MRGRRLRLLVPRSKPNLKMESVSRRWSRLFAFIALAAAAGGALAARSQEAHPPAGAVIEVRADLVRVPVSVTGKDSALVGDLHETNFRILEDGNPVPVKFFAPADAPAQVLVLVETGPAVYLIEREHLIAAYSLLGGLAPSDQVALATYDQSARLLLPFTTDKIMLARAMGGLEYTLGMANLDFYDSVAACLESLAALPGKRAMVVLSTGLDSTSEDRWNALEAKLRASDVTIFPVALGGSLRDTDSNPKSAGNKKAKKHSGAAAVSVPTPTTQPPPELSFQRATQALQTIAQLTGGQAYLPSSPDDFVAIYKQIAAILRHQYLLAFQPSAHDGHFHTIEVQVVDSNSGSAPSTVRQGYRIYARRGYLAPAL